MTVSFGLKGLCTLTLYTIPQHGPFSLPPLSRGGHPVVFHRGAGEAPHLHNGRVIWHVLLYSSWINYWLHFYTKTRWRPAQQVRHPGFTINIWNWCVNSWLEHGDTSSWQIKGRTQKIHVNPQIFVTLQYPPSQVCICVPFADFTPFIWFPHVKQQLFNEHLCFDSKRSFHGNKEFIYDHIPRFIGKHNLLKYSICRLF